MEKGCILLVLITNCKGSFMGNFYETAVPCKATIYRTVEKFCTLGSIIVERNR
jgi:hypothetical protein